MALQIPASLSYRGVHSCSCRGRTAAQHPLLALPRHSGALARCPHRRSAALHAWRHCSFGVPCRHLTQPSSWSRGGAQWQTHAAAASAEVGVYPAGKKQAKVKLPAVLLQVTAEEVLHSTELVQEVVAALAGGATGVVLSEGATSGGGQLYEAACKLKELLRGRAALLITDRTDIVDVAGADGVLLSSKGVPTVVARRVMQGSANLVGRIVSSAAEASAAAADGANLVVLEDWQGGLPSVEDALAAKQKQRGLGIPLIVSVPSDVQPSDAASIAQLPDAGVDGFCAEVGSLSTLAGALRPGGDAENARDRVSSILGSLSVGNGALQEPEASPAADDGRSAGLGQLLSQPREDLVEAERAMLSDTLALLDEVCPEMDERGLLQDALLQLDELFLLVVVGEFNSGKSTVINALLGARFLEEGILPTTNEICVLKYADNGTDQMTQDADGSFVRYLPAELLREVNVVDTPGTNVILERQQRLTEEYVPRADLVLFVMSADRPFTESEVKFLKYIRRWGKKVVFVVNKVDILASEGEVAEVGQFVAVNAQRALGVEAAQVLPVSSRLAVDAKLAHGSSLQGGLLTRAEQGQLAGDAAWGASRFQALERFIFEFLVGQEGKGEAIRLKLQTPLFVADALLDAARQQLENELSVAEQEAEAVKLVRAQLAKFRADMEKDSAAQRGEATSLVSGAIQRGKEFVDTVLQLSNVDALSAYIFGSKKQPSKLPIAKGFEAEVVGDTAQKLRGLVREHQAWLAHNCDSQLAAYRTFAEERVQQLGRTFADLVDPSEGGHDEAYEARRQWRAQRSAEGGETTTTAPGNDAALAVVARLDTKAAAALLEEEVREAVISTAGNAVGAGAAGVVLTWFLPTTLEDLLAVALAGLVGYVSILNLPLRRMEAKAKLERVASGYVQEVQGKLKEELEAGVAACCADIMAFIEPLERLTAAEVERVRQAEQRRTALVDRLDDLKQRAANVE